MKNKHLVLIFLMLVAAVILSRREFGKRERSFQTTLVEVDTTALSLVVFLPADGREFSLSKETSGWILTDGERSIIADPEPVGKLLTALSRIETRHIAAKNKELWPVYGVDEKQSIRLRLYESGKLIEDFLLGREDFDPETQSVVSFLRLQGENTVFAVDGFQVMNIGRSFDEYRNRLLLRMKREMDVTDFSWESPDTTLEFSRTSQGWMLGAEALDSMEVEDYLNIFRNVSGETFADDFDELRSDEYFYRKLSIRGKNIPEPLVITFFRDTLGKQPYVIRSSQNPRSFFYSDSSGLYKRLAPGWESWSRQ